MKKKSNKNGYAKVLKDKVDEIALECGFYKESNNPANLSSNYRDPVLPLLISFYATFQMVQRMRAEKNRRHF